jgi:drug/metabolite transporter (DMT)-like permease
MYWPGRVSTSVSPAAPDRETNDGEGGATTMNRRAVSVLLLVLTMLIWGGTYVVTKAGLDEVPPMLFALLRFGVASLVLVPFALWRGGLTIESRRSWQTLLLMAVAGVGLYYIGFNLALHYTTASQGALVQSSIPAITAIMAAIWLRERLPPRRIVGIGLAVAGVILVVVRSGPNGAARDPLMGNLLMFGTVLAWGVYTMLAKRVANLDPIVVVAAISLLGGLLLIPAALVEGQQGMATRISVANWGRIVYLGALASAGGYLFYSRALQDLEASQVGTFVNLVPVIGVVSGVVILGDTITPLALLGGALVIGGVWISSLQTR